MEGPPRSAASRSPERKARGMMNRSGMRIFYDDVIVLTRQAFTVGEKESSVEAVVLAGHCDEQCQSLTDGVMVCDRRGFCTTDGQSPDFVRRAKAHCECTDPHIRSQTNCVHGNWTNASVHKYECKCSPFPSVYLNPFPIERVEECSVADIGIGVCQDTGCAPEDDVKVQIKTVGSCGSEIVCKSPCGGTECPPPPPPPPPTDIYVAIDAAVPTSCDAANIINSRKFALFTHQSGDLFILGETGNNQYPIWNKCPAAIDEKNPIIDCFDSDAKRVLFLSSSNTNGFSLEAYNGDTSIGYLSCEDTWPSQGHCYYSMKPDDTFQYWYFKVQTRIYNYCYMSLSAGSYDTGMYKTGNGLYSRAKIGGDNPSSISVVVSGS